jgi:pimeloyl-ACP methyl ester carboxylesterase
VALAVAYGGPMSEVTQVGDVQAGEYRAAGLLVREHRVQVPIDWADPVRFGSIEVFAREVVDPKRAADDLPLLLFLQGGPGGQGPRPMPGGWLATATKTHRVVLLDQRGTGRSSRVDGRVISRFSSPDAAADYLACFRGDAIVADAEHLRATVYGGRRWATLGQSYGGFLTLVYLSRHPEALTACYVTGGLPGTTATAEDVYRHTYPRQAARNRELARLHASDVGALNRLADRLAVGDVTLPTGEPFSVRRLQTLGMPFGMSTGIDALHWLLDTAFDDGTDDPSSAFCAAVAHETAFEANPLYAVLQEVIYHQGDRAGGWAAQSEHDRWPSFAVGARPLQLTGEAIFPWMYAEHRALQPFAAAADVLADRTSWPALYDVDRLAANDVPVAAAQYYDDPYVDLDLALGTATGIGNAQVWVTNEHLHDGLRVAGDVILPRLIDLAAGTWTVTGR